MSQPKPAPATTQESALSTLIGQIQTAMNDANTVRWYNDRDMSPAKFSAFLADCQAFQALLLAAGNKGNI
jgi:hypothetical protein